MLYKWHYVHANYHLSLTPMELHYHLSRIEDLELAVHV